MLIALLKTMRPRQWTKNGFVFAAIVFDRQLSLSNLTPLARSLAAFGLFCLLSSSVYIINDLLDVEADRLHPTKRNRPIASGELPRNVAVFAAVLLVSFTVVVSFLLSSSLAWIVLLYFGINLAYSTYLKHVPLLDVIIIAAGLSCGSEPAWRSSRSNAFRPGCTSRPRCWRCMSGSENAGLS